MRNILQKIVGSALILLGLVCLHAAIYSDPGGYFSSGYGSLLNWIDGEQVLAGVVSIVAGYAFWDM